MATVALYDLLGFNSQISKNAILVLFSIVGLKSFTDETLRLSSNYRVNLKDKKLESSCFYVSGENTTSISNVQMILKTVNVV